MLRTFLHVGCGPARKDRTTPGFNTNDWNELRLDIDASVNPDIISTMLDMSAVEDSSVDAVFSSHNIEHLYFHEVPVALAEFKRVLKDDGFVVITCPDLQSVCALIAEDKLTDSAYISPAGPIAPLDILYGHRPSMTRGNLYMAHRCGFTQKVLSEMLQIAGFSSVASIRRGYPSFDLYAVATKAAVSESDLRVLAAAHFPAGNQLLESSADNTNPMFFMTATAPPVLSVDAALQLAIAYHQAGKLQEAAELYRTILQTNPDHPEANHNMGALAVQAKQPEAALSHFMAALEADPMRRKYWISYIDALYQAGLLDDARQVLAVAMQQGLQGVDELQQRLNGGVQAPDQNIGTRPTNRQIDELVSLFSAGRLDEAAGIAKQMTERYPQHEFGWKALGAVYKQMGNTLDALSPMQKAAALSPNDVEAHYNLGVTLQDLGQFEAAEQAYRHALQINPDYADAHGNLGVTLQNMGRLADAEASYRRAVQLKPDYVAAHCNLGNVLSGAGRLDEAEACYRRALQLKPDDALIHCNLGNILKEQGRGPEAQVCYRKALEISPDNAHAHYNLGNLFKDTGQLAEAEDCYRQALRIEPDFALAHYNLGNLLLDRGLLEEARDRFRRVIRIEPDHADAHYNLGRVLKDIGCLDEAEASYRRAIQINPDYAEAHYNLGNILTDMKRLGEAEACYRQAIRIKPEFAQALCNLGNTLLDLDRPDEAEACFRHASQIEPDMLEAHYNLANILRELGRLTDAEVSYRRALEINPDFAEGYGNLGVTLLSSGRTDEAESCLRRAIQIKPDHAQAYCSLGSALQRRGALDEAIACFRRALEIKPDYTDAHSNLIFTLDLTDDADTVSMQQERRRWADVHANHLHQHRPFPNIPDSARRLRIGYVSADFRMHSAAFAFGAMLTCFDRERFEVVAYSNLALEDFVTRGFRQSATLWRKIYTLSDDAVADLIRADKIDILVDLSGHSAGNRLLVFARKPAPIQITAWGYAAGTGMSAMDVLFSDPIFVPVDGQHFYAERIVYLPSAIGFFTPHPGPDVNALPALAGNGITFGSFNRLAKVSDNSYRTWAEVLLAVPDSRLILKTAELDEDSCRERVIGHFTSAGVAAERIILLGKTSRDEHLAAFNRIDIALDPFPHGGGVTALEGLMMGVPLITLCWPSLTGRVSASIMTTLGLTDWIATTREQYVEIAIQKAADLQSLATLRGQLRGIFTSSVIGDQNAYVRIVEQKYRKLWQAWCDRDPE